MAAEGTLTSTGYIKHHLQNLTFGLHPENGLGFAHTGEEAKEMGFWALHVDTMFWSIFLGALFLWLFRKVAKVATSEVPGGVQNFVEVVIEFIDNNCRETFTGKNNLVAPIALTLFVWILLMNTMDTGSPWSPASLGSST
jgi:F-type H+-transporting ATPase subunit a